MELIAVGPILFMSVLTGVLKESLKMVLILVQASILVFAVITTFVLGVNLESLSMLTVLLKLLNLVVV
jgi:hypothetical protein